MTISTLASSIQLACDGISSSYQFPFIAAAAADITVTSISSTGNVVLTQGSQYTLSLNTAGSNQLWGIGGSVTIIGTPPALGTYLLIQRTLPLTQPTSVRNQGNYYAQVTEQALDTLCMEIQQVAARTGQQRGIWATGILYNFGDVVQDGANGNNSQSYYMCAIANTSGVWATDLANGDWILAIQSALPSVALPLAINNGGTGAATAAGAQTNLGLGTMATQNASNVNITGGAVSVGLVSASTGNIGGVSILTTTAVQPASNKTITNSTLNNSSIGLVTPAAGVFTKVTSTDTSTIEGAGNAVTGGAFTASVNTTGALGNITGLKGTASVDAASIVATNIIGAEFFANLNTSGAGCTNLVSMETSRSVGTGTTATNTNGILILTPSINGGVVNSTGIQINNQGSSAVSNTSSALTILGQSGSVSNNYMINCSGVFLVNGNGNVITGSATITTTATVGFPWIPSCPGQPTGAPTAPYTNAAAMVVDTSNLKLWVLVGSTWRFAQLT